VSIGSTIDTAGGAAGDRDDRDSAERRARVAPARQVRARYMHHPLADVALAFAWIPFALAAHLLEADNANGSPDGLVAFISAVFLLSFAHQPLTVALVYGDPEQFRLRKAIFTWSPLVFIVAIVVGYEVSFALVAVVGALWNAEHTLMQRYGVTRIYGRMAGQDDGRLEKALLFSWLVFAALWVAADPSTPDRAAVSSFGENNRVAIDALTHFRSVAALLVVPASVALVVLAALWLRDERRRPVVNPVKWLYLASTALLFGLFLVDPIAGIMGYVGAHAVEYFVIVHQSLGRRYGGPEADDRALIGRAVRARPGRIGFLAAYVAVVIAVVYGLAHLGSPLAYTVVFFTLGGMHVFYDGFIWKLRRPVVAQSLAIPSSPAT
jgi:hypothetical protein